MPLAILFPRGGASAAGGEEGGRAAAKAFYKRDRILKKRTARGRGAFSLSSPLSFCGQFVLFSVHIISWPDLWQRGKGLA